MDTKASLTRTITALTRVRARLLAELPDLKQGWLESNARYCLRVMAKTDEVEAVCRALEHLETMREAIERAHGEVAGADKHLPTQED